MQKLAPPCVDPGVAASSAAAPGKGRVVAKSIAVRWGALRPLKSLGLVSSLALSFGAFATGSAHAAAGGLDGAALSPLWALPFVGLLLSIAVLPLVAPSLWHHHYGKIAAAWALAFLGPFAVLHGPAAAFGEFVHAMALDYVPFVILIGALFVVAGGILVTGNLHGRPVVNVGILATGTVLASLIGTTGASMLLIRPLLRANDGRRHTVHVVVFFIFLVSNIGGALSPLGDPPLFLGYLRGVDFFWTTGHLLPETLVAAAALLGVFFLLDHRLYANDADFRGRFDPTPDTGRIGLAGGVNLALMLLVVLAVLGSGLWKPGISFDVFGTPVELQNLVRDLLLIAAALASLKLTAPAVRARNSFSWEPIAEVAKLFAGIFITIVPVIAMLKAAEHGPFAPLVTAVSGPDGQPVDALYFWATGLLSSFLDNAPTYLVFFNLAGGDAAHLMGDLGGTLAAISAGAVFMGANTYIGNAPNFMVKAIAESAGIRMPSFFGYMAWSFGILTPLFLVLTWLFFL
jgi:Na+/H+ antiporter NhaD/arsenite permease-like protein